MRWIRLALLVFAIPTSSAVAGAVVPQSQEQVVSGMEDTYRGVQSLRADFVQTTRSAALGTEDQQAGHIRLKRPRKMRMEFTGADAKLVVTDGTSIWIYSPSDKQVFVYRDLGGGSGMGVLLDDLDKLDQVFNITLVAQDAGSESYLLDLKPREQASFKQLQIEVSRSKYTLERILIVDQMDNQTELSFSQVKMNTDMPDSDFAFEAPPGTELIEGM